MQLSRLIFAASLVLVAFLVRAEETLDTGGTNVATLHVNSPFQSGRTIARVILPDNFTATRKYSVLYVLPVEAGEAVSWGDPVKEIQQTDVANKYALVCVVPSFSDLPWYCDHPTDHGKRQESHLLRSVIPLIEQEYPNVQQQPRHLVGFSKSGWGAWGACAPTSRRVRQRSSI